MKRQRVSWRVRKVGDGWEGTVLLPASLRQCVRAIPAPTRDHRAVRARVARAVPSARMKASAAAPDKASALMQAAGMAERIMSNPLVQSAMPPGTGAAVRGIGIAAKLAKDGRVQDIGKAIAGPGAKRLVGALKSLF